MPEFPYIQMHLEDENLQCEILNRDNDRKYTDVLDEAFDSTECQKAPQHLVAYATCFASCGSIRLTGSNLEDESSEFQH